MFVVNFPSHQKANGSTVSAPAEPKSALSSMLYQNQWKILAFQGSSFQSDSFSHRIKCSFDAVVDLLELAPRLLVSHKGETLTLDDANLPPKVAAKNLRELIAGRLRKIEKGSENVG